jgi:hypothetical protein
MADTMMERVAPIVHGALLILYDRRFQHRVEARHSRYHPRLLEPLASDRLRLSVLPALAVGLGRLCSSSDETHDALLMLYENRFQEQVEVATTDIILDNWDPQRRSKTASEPAAARTPRSASMLAAFTAGFGRLLPVFGEIAGPAAMPARGLPALVLTAVAMLATLTAGFRRLFRVLREAPLGAAMRRLVRHFVSPY